MVCQVTKSVSTFTTVELSSKPLLQLTWELEQDPVIDDPWSIYLRLYNYTSDVDVSVNSGEIVHITQTTSDTSSVLTFAGAAFESLPSGAFNIRVEPLGRFLDKMGNPISPNFIVNQSKGTISTRVACYGAIKIYYNIFYAKWKYTFSALTDSAFYYNGNSSKLSINFNPPVIYAIRKDNIGSGVCKTGASATVATFEPTLPTVNKKEIVNKKIVNKIHLEIDKDFPITFRGTVISPINILKLDGTISSTDVAYPAKVNGRIRIYTILSQSNIKINIIDGSIDNDELSTGIKFTDSIISGSLERLETVSVNATFSNSYSFSLPRPCVGNLSVKNTPVFDEHGAIISGYTIAKPDDTIIIVDRSMTNRKEVITEKERRKVAKDEICIVDSDYRTLPVYGTITNITFTTKYYSIPITCDAYEAISDVMVGRDNIHKKKKEILFKTARVLCYQLPDTENGYISNYGMLECVPPSNNFDYRLQKV